MVDPCQKHLECFNGCKHLSATDLAQTRNNLVLLEARFDTAVRTIEARKANILVGRQAKLPASSAGEAVPNALQAVTRLLEKRISTGVGLDNQLHHAQVRLAAVRKLLETAPGELVFPDGVDLSHDSAKSKGMVLDDVQ